MISKLLGVLLMKNDMSREAVTLRLKTVSELRRVCLSLADSSAGKSVRKKYPDNPSVQRVSRALGEK